ncbi:helix-turn-helix domain-containing protein [Pedobacter sp. ISL-68]|uniref:helix-turn-helix domain-containing protein n=1 Tax=unclassified Pedobacter TaxID=2628915 RepID=UPI001BEBEB8B|nr:MULTISPECIES: helix-turn-helix transcriptional regulator [unclassified Pedobacter]MBT2559773.1 helix-turn-helix domain-containing protein [Pedobacter sp. ISL-64]MBT2592078.1 helix-turn-helix domain-containing protein [Pedobacter sp. ISL-68]
MQTLHPNQQLPVYTLEPDEIAGNKNFRVYHFEGTLPNQSELLIPHRKDHYLVVLNRQSDSRQWIDMTPYVLKNNTIYFAGPSHIIVKEGFKQLWSTGIAFTKEFLSLQENASLSKLPIIENRHDGHELALTAADLNFVEDMLAKINTEYQKPSEWQQRMLTAYLTVLLTYLSRLYTEQFKESDHSADKLLLKSFQAKIDENYRELHEVGDYASLLNISAGHLSEVVKIQSGKPAIKHIHERLVLEAQRLLFHTEHSLKEIAFDLGFSDTSYFNRFFKRETGVTPATYRANIREMYH